MKKLLCLLLLMAAMISSCQKDSPAVVDTEALQKKLDADPDMAKAREILHQHGRALASIPRGGLDAVFEKIHSCGFYGATAPMPELEKCLAGYPNGDTYVKCEKLIREYKEKIQAVEQKFPEFAQLEPRQKGHMIVRVNETHAKEMISDYLERKHKK